MKANDLKAYMLEDIDRLKIVMGAAGFHDIWQNSSDEIRAAMPDGENKTSVVVKLNDKLYTSMYSIDFSGDIIGAISEVMNESFKDTLIFIHSCLGLSLKYSKKKVRDPLKVLRQYAKTTQGGEDNRENKLYSKSYLNKFVSGLHKNIIEEGITPKVARQFDLMYDPSQSRIIFPHYDWEHNDRIVGVKGRTTLDTDIAKELDIPKYWNYIKGYLKTHNLYGFNLAKEQLKSSKVLILFEAEKSVLKQFTFENGKGYSVALGGHVISENQVKFILSHTTDDCEIVIAYDKDVMTDKTIGDKEYNGKEYIENECRKFLGMRKVSYIFDSHDILSENSSPIDEGIKKWNYLYKWRKNYK